jgi:hypothetical protein
VEVKAASLDEVVRRLDEMGADRDGAEIWEGNPDSGQVEYSWSCRRIPPERAGNLFERFPARSSPVMQRNEELARRINEEARSNPESPYAGKFVGIVNGAVAVVADSWSELGRKIRQIGASPDETLGVEASRDPDVVEEIGTYP